MRRFPFPIPDGWFQVAWADELTTADVLPLRAFGKRLVLERDDSHGLVLRDLGVRRDREGTIPVVERNRMIFAWHHAAGAPPTWEVPSIDEASRDDWTPFETHRWEIATHNQEIGENSVDRAHFRYVHGTKEVPDSSLVLEGHVRRASQRVLLATPRGEVRGRIDVTAYGMGFTTTRFSGIAETLLLISHTPIDDERVVSRFSFTQPIATAGSNVAKAIVRDVVKQMNEDIPIWEHKRYLTKPMLCDGDGPIGAYRRWATQFYSGLPGAVAIG